ncbi:hypothetical protein Tco_0042149 [Tanacetum coccineum]
MKESSKKAEAEIVQESSSKREGEALEQESSKKQKLEEDKESEELKQCLEIIPDDGDDVTIDATPLSTRSPTIVDYKIYQEGKKSYFQIISRWLKIMYRRINKDQINTTTFDAFPSNIPTFSPATCRWGNISPAKCRWGKVDGELVPRCQYLPQRHVAGETLMLLGSLTTAGYG